MSEYIPEQPSESLYFGVSRDVSGSPVTAIGCVSTRRGRVCEGMANMRWYRERLHRPLSR